MKKFKTFLSISMLIPMIMVTACGEQREPGPTPVVDTTAPTISSSELSRDVAVIGDTVEVTVNATDDVSAADKLAITVTVTDPSGTASAIEGTSFEVDAAGNYSVVATVKDEAGNEATSTAMTIEVLEGWNEEFVTVMEEEFGEAIPFGVVFGTDYDYYTMVNVYQTPLGCGADAVIEDVTETDALVDDFVERLLAAGYEENALEVPYQEQSYTEDVTHIGVYDKHVEGNDYIRVTTHVYASAPEDEDGTTDTTAEEVTRFYIEIRNATYVTGHTWDANFVDGVFGADVAAKLVPSFEFASDNEDGVIYLTDFNPIMNDAGMYGIQGKLYDVTLDEIEAYLTKLEALGYYTGLIEELEADGYLTPMWMDYDTYEMCTLQIADYTTASTPFYTLDIIYMPAEDAA